MAVADNVRALVEPVCTDLGLELVDVELAGGVLRVTIDREGGVDIEAISLVTRETSRLLDHHDPVPGRYTLEVSSPGLERTLRTPTHFAKAIGRTVRVKTKPSVEGERRLDGVLVLADDEGIEVAEGDAAGPRRRVAYDDIERARTVFEWGPAPKPGKAPKTGRGGNKGTDSGAKGTKVVPA
jgi:ribosome maturation factor RimP